MQHNIQRDLEVAGHSFPTRKNYLDFFDTTQEKIDDDIAVAIQREWHSRGQNGCVFAMHAARQMDQQQWSHSVHHTPPSPEVMSSLIDQAVQDPHNQLHSMIFPQIADKKGVESLIELAMAAGCTLYEESLDNTAVFRLRLPLDEVESWVLGFAPIEEIPITRRAPFTELVFRTKTKDGIVHESLNNDPTQAHVADISLGFTQEVTGQLIHKSSQRTARLLGGQAYRARESGAKAKTTFGISLAEKDS